jgi:hypothetical protein
MVASKPTTLHDRLTQSAADITFRVDELRKGQVRDALVKQLRATNNAIEINMWLSSPGLRAPVESRSVGTTGREGIGERTLNVVRARSS